MLLDWDGLLGGANAHINLGAAELFGGVALHLLGLTEFRRWVSIMAVVALAIGKPAELVRIAVQRGYFSEELAKDCGMSEVAAELFLTALRGGQNRFRGVYDIVLVYEQGMAPSEESSAATRPE
jgi:hypothetical protein